MNNLPKVMIMLIFLSIISTSFAQKKKLEGLDLKYRRSSLHTILVESKNFPQKETVLNAYYTAPFPSKYNNHSLAESSFDPSLYPVVEGDKLIGINRKGVVNGNGKAKKKKKLGFLKTLTKAATADTSAAAVMAKELPTIINKYFKKNKIANQMVAKWFNRQEDGSFDMSLIAERGYYDATEMEASIAKSTTRGTASLADAGEELIKNSFVVVSKMNFVSNEIIAAAILVTSKALATKIKNAIAQKIANIAADKIYKKTREGYSVWTTAYLYQLEWNDSIAAVFYNDYWIDASNLDSLKKEKFDMSDLFSLKLVGKEKSTNLVMFSLKEQKTDEQLVEKATIRNIEKVYNKLQKKYDVFKTKTPLYSGDPITARIGMKEGLKGGEKFEVFEQIIDSKTGLTKYVSKGKITVNKKKIWDNRYNAGDESEIENPDITATHFKGGKNLYSGMLIKQLK